MSPLLIGSILGAIFAIGLLVVVLSSPPARPVKLEDRIAPYLRESPKPSALLAGTPGSLPGAARRILLPRARSLSKVIDRWVGGSGSVRRRLRALDSPQTIEDFRLEQAIWASVGLAAGAVGGVAMTFVSPKFELVSVVLFALGGAIGGLFGRDWWLSRQVRRREERILAEFPVVADLLALSVTAGEGPAGAIDRVSRLVGGELGHSLQGALAKVRTGTPLTEALEELAKFSSLEPLTRFIDGIVIAVERGTPLSDVLRAQAVDVRESGKRRLLESGGRKELAMMVPVVFLLLPTTVVFALFPGLFAIVELSQ